MKKIGIFCGLLLCAFTLSAYAITPGWYVNFGGGYTDYTIAGTELNYSTLNYGGGVGYLSPTIDQTPIFWGAEADINYNPLMLNLGIYGLLGAQLFQNWAVFGKAGITANYIAVIGGLPSFTRPDVGGGIAFQATEHIRFTAGIDRVFLTHDVGFTNYNLGIQIIL